MMFHDISIFIICGNYLFNGFLALAEEPIPCDIKSWYMDLVGDGVFDVSLNEEQKELKSKIEQIIKKSKTDKSLIDIDCKELKEYEDKLRGEATTNEEEVEIIKEDQDDFDPTEMDETELDDTSSIEDKIDQRAGKKGDKAPDKISLQFLLHKMYHGELPFVPHVHYLGLMIGKWQCFNESEEEYKDKKEKIDNEKLIKNTDKVDTKPVENVSKDDDENKEGKETKRDTKETASKGSKEVKDNKGIVKDDKDSIEDNDKDSVNDDKYSEKSDKHSLKNNKDSVKNDKDSVKNDHSVKNDKHSVKDDKDNTKDKKDSENYNKDNVKKNKVDVKSKKDTKNDNKDTINDNKDAIKDNKDTIKDEIADTAEKDNANKHMLRDNSDIQDSLTSQEVAIRQKEIDIKTKEHEEKINKLEMQILKMENLLLRKNLDASNDSVSYSKLENHILKLENELLKMNQSFISLKFENEQLKKYQNKYLQLEDKRQEMMERPLQIPDHVTKAIQAIDKHQTRINELSDLVKAQGTAVSGMKDYSDKLKVENEQLRNQLKNQTHILSRLLARLETLETSVVSSDKKMIDIERMVSTKSLKDESSKRIEDHIGKKKVKVVIKQEKQKTSEKRNKKIEEEKKIDKQEPVKIKDSVKVKEDKVKDDKRKEEKKVPVSKDVKDDNQKKDKKDKAPVSEKKKETKKIEEPKEKQAPKSNQKNVVKEGEARNILYQDPDHKGAKDCYDLFKSGKKRDGINTINPIGMPGKKIKVFCDMKNEGWTTIQRRQDGNVDFFRNWKDYREGFGNPLGDHWIGNDIIHMLTNQGEYSLRIEMIDWDRNKVRADYSDFWIDSGKEGFKLHISGYSGNAGDAFKKHNGVKFSTKDVDNDKAVKEFGGSCAKRFQGAWWYYRCYQSNLNGKYYSGGEVPGKNYDGVAWKPWKGAKYSLKRVDMKIRPKNK